MADEIAITGLFPDSKFPGNAFPVVENFATADIDRQLMGFIQDDDGVWSGTARVPNTYGTVATAKIACDVLADATTGVARVIVSTSATADGESLDVALTAITAQDVTMPTTAKVIKRLEFTIATVPVQGDKVTVRFFHNGDTATGGSADTLAVPLWMMSDPVLELTK